MKRSSSKETVAVNLSKERLDTLSKLLVEDIKAILGKGVRSWLNERSVLLAQMLLNAEVLERSGERYERSEDKDCVRWGEQPGSADASF